MVGPSESKLTSKENMKTIELTQGQVTFVDDIDYEYLMQWKWCANWMSKGYRAVRTLPQVEGGGALRLHTVIAQRMGIDSKLIDHKDQNPLNNCRSNLRAATHSQNQHNRGMQKNNRTGAKGVSFQKASGKYMSQIKLHGKTYYLGYFDTIPEAEAVVIAKRKELVGEFACN